MSFVAPQTRAGGTAGCGAKRGPNPTESPGKIASRLPQPASLRGGRARQKSKMRKFLLKNVWAVFWPLLGSGRPRGVRFRGPWGSGGTGSLPKLATWPSNWSAAAQSAPFELHQLLLVHCDQLLLPLFFDLLLPSASDQSSLCGTNPIRPCTATPRKRPEPDRTSALGAADEPAMPSDPDGLYGDCAAEAFLSRAPATCLQTKPDK